MNRTGESLRQSLWTAKSALDNSLGHTRGEVLDGTVRFAIFPLLIGELEASLRDSCLDALLITTAPDLDSW